MYIKKYWGSFIGGSDDSLNLQNLDEYNTPARRIRITATPEEYDAMNKILADFARNPLEYDLSEMMGEDEITDMAYQVEMLRKELYEASGRNRNYHAKAEDVKHLLSDWEGCRWLHCHQPDHGGGLQGWLLLPGEAGRRLGQRLALYRW